MLQLSRPFRWWRGISALMVSFPLFVITFVFWRASRATEEATAEILSKSDVAVQVAPVDRVVSAAVDPLASSPGFRDVAAYQGMIAVSARAGLFVYDRKGTLVRSDRVGIELPSAELAGLSEGIAAGSAELELFIATRGAGLLAFNGTHFRQILPADPALRTITTVLVLGSGRILLGTERRGLLVFDGRRLAPFPEGLKAAHITALAGNDGDLWIGTLANGLFHHHAGQLENLLTSLPDPQVLSLAIRDDRTYVGTPLGVVEFQAGRRVRTLADGFFASTLALRGETLEVATEDEGILDVPLQARAVRPPAVSSNPDAPAAPVVRLASVEGDVYALGDNSISVYDLARQSWQRVLTAGAALSDRDIASLALSSGRLWIGYFDRGLDVADAGLEHVVHHEDDVLFCINRIVPDPDQTRTAVATANGLVLFDAGGKPRQVMERKDGLLSDHVTDVAFRNGGMVVATPSGLSFVDRSGVRSLYAFHGLVNNHVYSLATMGSRTVAGTLGGLSILDDDSVRVNYTTANSHLKHNWITAVACVGDEWFAGTYGAGVFRLDSAGEWHSFPDLKEGFVVNPNALLVSGGRVYAGSLDRGLFVYDRATERWNRSTLGLPSENVTALAAGGGHLYVGTDNGLVRIAEGALR
jgi:ligand-binding sensor domain-containing protein